MRHVSGTPRSAHVVVLGNEKGGSGKSTTAMHVIVALLNAGQRVASIDADSRQLSLTHYLANRRRWARRYCLDLRLPTHFTIPRGTGKSVAEIETSEFAAFAEAIAQVEHDFDFVVIDTPGTNSYLMRLSHSLADTLITPVNDSFVDFDVLGRVDPVTFEVVEVSHYADLVREARRQRRLVDDRSIDWIVVRNRLSMLDSRNKRNVIRGLQELALSQGFRLADGISERVIFREFFPMGLTALDDLDKRTLGGEPTVSHVSARGEIRELLRVLRLPVDERGRRRAEARRIWEENAAAPLEMLNIIAD